MKKVVCKVHKEDLSISTTEVEDKPLDLNFVRQHIGNSDGNALFECMYQVVPGAEDIVIIRDLLGRKKGLAYTLETHDGISVYGDFIICVIDGTSIDDLNLRGMTEAQAALIKEMLGFKTEIVVTTQIITTNPEMN